MAEVLFLGTGASIPSRSRSLPCVAVRHHSDIILFDCGEGTQRQMMCSPFSFMKVSGIFLTHLHGDHILGLPGLLQTMGMSGRRKELIIGGPAGIKESVTSMLASCERTYVEKDPDPSKELEFPLRIIEMDRSEVKMNGYSILSFRTDHSIRSCGFIYQEDERPGRFDRSKALQLSLRPGKDFKDIQNGKTVNGVSPKEIIGQTRKGCKIVYTGDTAPSSEVCEASKDADLLIHEATYADKEEELASTHKHSTASQAAKCAAGSGSKMLALIHASNRYDDLGKLKDEASRIFSNVIMSEDMMMLNVR